MSRAVSTTEDPQLGPPVSKYPPTSGYGQSSGNSRRNMTFGHMHRGNMNQSAGPEQIDSLYPSGFPRQGVTARKTSRTADRMLIHFKQDPDIEVRPVVSGTMVSSHSACCSYDRDLYHFCKRVKTIFRSVFQHRSTRRRYSIAYCVQLLTRMVSQSSCHKHADSAADRC